MIKIKNLWFAECDFHLYVEKGGKIYRLITSGTPFRPIQKNELQEVKNLKSPLPDGWFIKGSDMFNLRDLEIHGLELEEKGKEWMH